MIKRRTRSIVATDPPTRAERKQIAEYETLAALSEPDEGQAARLAALAASLTVEQTRLTVAALNTLQWGQYEANRRAVVGYIEAHTGEPWRDAIKRPEADALIEAGLRWARVAAALVGVETRTASRVADTATGWAATEAAAFASLPAFLDDVPADLAGALDEVVFDLNPGLFGVASPDADAEEAKKNGGISAS